jgi:hypothetical protein
MKLLVVDEVGAAWSGGTETNRHARARHSRAGGGRHATATFSVGNRLAEETRKPKAETRKKAEGRNPKRLRSVPGAPGFRELRLAGKNLLGDSVPVAGRRLGFSGFGFASRIPP